MPLKNKFHISRRELLQWGGGAALTLLSSELMGCAHLFNDRPPAANTSPDFSKTGFAVARRSDDPLIDNHHLAHGTSASSLVLANFAGTQVKEISLDFHPHQTSQNPRNIAQLVTVQKWGANGACIDFITEKVTKLALPENSLFFGHSCFSPDGELFFVSSMDYNAAEGRVLVYSSRDLKLIRSLPSHGINPHEIQLSKSGKSFFVINSYFRPSQNHNEEYKNVKAATSNLAQFDVNTFALLNLRELNHREGDSHRHFKKYGHFVNKDDTNFVCLGVGDRTTVLTLLKGDRAVNLDHEALVSSYKGETLSARYLPDDKALITMPEVGHTFLVDFNQEKVLKSFALDNCKSLITHPDQEHTLICHGATPQTHLAVYSKTAGDIIPTPPTLSPLIATVEPHFPRGSHATEIIWPT